MQCLLSGLMNHHKHLNIQNVINGRFYQTHTHIKNQGNRTRSNLSEWFINFRFFYNTKTASIISSETS